MSCEVISRGDLEAYVFGEAGPRVARAVEGHLFGCGECAAEMRQLRSERRLFRTRLEAEDLAVPAFEDVLARIDGEPARPAASVFDDVLSRGGEPARPAAPAFEGVLGHIDEDRARPAAVPAFEDVLARIDGERARPVVRRVAPGGLAARLRAAPVVLAAAAAIGWIWMRGAGAPIVEPAAPSPAGDDALIVAEPVCASDGPMSGVEEDKGHVAVSQEPNRSVDVSVASRPSEVARIGEDTGMCAPGTREACGGGEAQMTYACEDAVAWCAAGRP